MPAKYWHKLKTDTSKKTKVACFFEAVVAVKNVPATNTTKEYVQEGECLLPVDILL